MALDEVASEAIRNEIADALESLKRLLKSGDQYKATCVLRAPHLPDGDVVVSEDSAPEIIKAVERSFGR